MVTKNARPRIHIDIAEEPPAKTRLYVDEDVAEALRKVARAERMELGPFLEKLLRYWLRAERPQYRVVGDGHETGRGKRADR